jgi:putative DNA primase/helicase
MTDENHKQEAEDWDEFGHEIEQRAREMFDRYPLQENGPPKENSRAPDDTRVTDLAAISRLEYDRRRKNEARRLNVKVSTLDREVAKLRAQQKPAHNFLPHWKVLPWPEKVEGSALLDALRHQFTRYLVLPAHADIALALWVVLTWVFECFDITPYLSITSPTKRCGKTVLMTLLYWLSCRGKKADSMSKAAIYRSVHSDKTSLILDEVGWVLDPKDERQGILCGGFERNGYVEVCEGEGTAITPRLFSTYCPKAFGLIGKLTATLSDRSICIPMRRKLRTEKVERMRRKDNEENAKLRQQCLRWANDNADALAKARPVVFDELNDRALDFWEPLLTIAAVVGGDWLETARKTALALSGDGEDDAANMVLLRDLQCCSTASPKSMRMARSSANMTLWTSYSVRQSWKSSARLPQAHGQGGITEGGFPSTTWPRH